MVNRIKIGGKTRPILFGHLAFRKMEGNPDMTLAKIGAALESRNPLILPDVIYYGLLAGNVAEYVELPDNFSADTVAAWMDMEPLKEKVIEDVLTWLLQGVENVFGKQEATGEGEEPPKKPSPGKTSTGRK
jgi:hypothetical protein